MHVPFCLHKCGYCDFNSWAETRREFQDEWLWAISKQVDYWSPRTEREIFDTVVWGGGTPSLLHTDILQAFMQKIQSSFSLSKDVEVTVECNPETLNQEKLTKLWDAGVNRLSIGIQSFEDLYLQRLERQTTRDANLKVLELVASKWPGRWSLDLMFALPEQSLERWLGEMDLALSFNPSHISAYQLTLTTARSKNWRQAPEDELLEFFVLTQERFAEAGLEHYEVSNFARPGYECRHNLHYWNLHSFLGLGPGAAGLIPAAWALDHAEAGSTIGFHQRVAPRWETWLQKVGSPAESGAWLETRSLEDHFKEMLLMNFRLTAGFDLLRWGDHALQMRQVLETMSARGLVEEVPNQNKWRATTRGMQILDTTIQMAYALFDFEKIR